MAEYTYNGRNQLHQTKVEDALFIAIRGYDNAGRLTSVTNGGLDTTGYTLTADGRRETITRNGVAETYGYDNARQVSNANYGSLSTLQNWTYDPAGNRVTAVNSGVTTTYGTAPDHVDVNQYTSITGGGFLPPSPSYDANGNTLSLPRPDGTALALAWNIHNELISATNGAGDTAAYQYDAFGRRTRRTETIGGVTATTWFFTNGWNVELEHDGTQYTKRMTWGLDLSQSLQGAGGVGGLVMVEELPSGAGAAVPYFPTYDGNGNISAWVDGSGTVLARQRYDAFGNIIDQTGTAPSNYGFSTKPIEKVTGLHYYGYRYYDPVTGRWPSRDPIAERGGLNLYGFVGNNGVQEIDELGLFVTDPSDVFDEIFDGFNGIIDDVNNGIIKPVTNATKEAYPGTIHVDDECTEEGLKNCRYVSEHETPKILRRLPTGGKEVEADALYVPGSAYKLKNWSSAHITCDCYGNVTSIIVVGASPDMWAHGKKDPPVPWPSDNPPYLTPPDRGQPPLIEDTVVENILW